jgi:hypothetical protein
MQDAPAALARGVVYRNPLDLPRIGYADIVRNAAEGVYVEPPAQARRFSRKPPAFHEDPDAARLFPAFEEVAVTYPPAFTVSLRNATLLGFRSVLSPEGYFVNDMGFLDPADLLSFAAGLGQSDEITQLLPARDHGVFVPAGGGPRPVHIEGPVVLLTSREPGNYGSFLYRDLVKLVNLVEIPPTWSFLVHIPSKSYAQLLALAGLPMDRVIPHDFQKTYVIDQAIIPGLRTPLAFADPETHAFYERLRLRCESGARGRRIYVSRHSVSAARPSGRVMLNEAELIDRLRSLRFDIVEPQFLTASEQIATFAAADLVVGPSGAGMFNAVFCRPGTRLIDIESEPHWICPHTCLFASAGLDYGIVEGLATDDDWSAHHKPWRVNIDALSRRIATIGLEEGGSMPDTPTVADDLLARLWSIPDLTGEAYTAVLQRFHRTFQPRNYLEIGVSSGATLDLAECFAIGVDPNPAIDRPVLRNKPACCFFQMTSDSFFQRFDPSVLFGQPVDMAFLDGMHLFEFLLRDFINVERHCKPNSVIFMHDCIPTDEYVGRREIDDHRLRSRSAHPEWWTGDVWKVLAILLGHRPDLRIAVFNAHPTGLVAVTRLDPTSRLLAERYFDLVAEYKDQTLTEHGDAHHRALRILDTRDYATFEALSSLFWL